MSICEKNTEVIEEVPGTSPAAHGKDHGEGSCAPAASGVPRWSRRLQALEDPMLEQVDAQKKAMNLWQAGSCQDPWPCG